MSIEHSTDSPLPFALHLLSHLAARPDAAAPFRLGHWLRVLGDGELDRLRRVLDLYLDGDEGVDLDDIVALTVLCALAEGATIGFEHGKVDTWIAALYVSSLFEWFRRRRWLLLDDALSIDPGKTVRGTVTVLGMHGAGLTNGRGHH